MTCRTLVNNHVFFQHPDLVRILGIHENVIAIMMNSIARASQDESGETASGEGQGLEEDTSHEMVSQLSSAHSMLYKGPHANFDIVPLFECKLDLLPTKGHPQHSNFLYNPLKVITCPPYVPYRVNSRSILSTDNIGSLSSGGGVQPLPLLLLPDLAPEPEGHVRSPRLHPRTGTPAIHLGEMIQLSSVIDFG